MRNLKYEELQKGEGLMTDLQVKYQALKETERANQKNEAIKAQEARAKERDAESKAREADTNAFKAQLLEREQARKEGREKFERANLIIEGVTGATTGLTQAGRNFTGSVKDLAGAFNDIGRIVGGIA